MITAQEIREIQANIQKLGEILQARRPGESFLLKDINQRVKEANPETEADLQYMTGLAVYGIGLMVRERIDGIEQTNFDLDELLKELFSLLAMQTDIILANVNNGRLIMPEKLSQDALYIKEGETKQ